MCSNCTYDGVRDPISRRYQLRRAAGLYWLIDMEQPGPAYIAPVPLNEEGAKLWEQIALGASLEDICTLFCKEYEIPLAQAQEDVNDFIEQLQAKGVDFGGFQ